MSYLESLQNFAQHIKESMYALLNELEVTHEYNHSFDINISLNGESTVIEFHADACERLLSMVNNEIAEFIEMNACRVNHVEEVI